MGGLSAMERACLAAAGAVLAAVAAFAAVRLWIDVPEVPPSPPLSEEPPVSLNVRGKLVDVPGFRADPGILKRTRVQLRSESRPAGPEAAPSPDGSFSVEGRAPRRALRLLVATALHVDLFDRSLDRHVSHEVPVDAPELDLGDVPLPRSAEFGGVDGRSEVDLLGVEIDAVEGTSTPDVGLARLGALLDHAANAPLAYVRGTRFHILHLPPGSYWVRGKAEGRWIPALRVRVEAGRDGAATLKEGEARGRLRGIVRDAGSKEPLGDVEITLGTPGWAGAATRDPARVLGRTSADGSYDLPLPAKEVAATFVLRGWRRGELNWGPKEAGRRDLDLSRD